MNATAEVGRMTVVAFDAMAADYDAAFTETRIGRMTRDAVWRRLDACFGPGDRVLELNCGTGEDAVHLASRGVHVVATDIAPAMVYATRGKVVAHGLSNLVSTRVLAIEEADRLREDPPFDGVLSDFGGMKCVAGLGGTAETLADLVRPGGVALLCVMGPSVPWEWVWFGVRGMPGKALRRWRRGGVPWKGITVHYPSIGKLHRTFSPWWRLVRVAAIGALVPPPYTAAWSARHVRLLATVNRWERTAETMWPLPSLADHYLAEFVRK